MKARRGFTIMQILFLLPVFAGILWMAFEIIAGALRLEGINVRQMQHEACVADITRRVRGDVGSAVRQAIEVSTNQGRLIIYTADRLVTYEVTGKRLVRTEQSRVLPREVSSARINHGVADLSTSRAGETATRPASAPTSTPAEVVLPVISYGWDMQGLGITFQIEPIGKNAGLVWLIFALPMQGEHGPVWTRPYTVAALIGREVSR